MKFCSVCSKRWGDDSEGSELQITKCEEHSNTLSAREVLSNGMTAGHYKKRQRAKQPIGRPIKLDADVEGRKKSPKYKKNLMFLSCTNPNENRG